MERELFDVLMGAVGDVVRGCARPRKCTYDDRAVLAVLFWAAVHDRPISWATKRCSWASHDRTRPLPSSATMSRRLRDPRIGALLAAVLGALRIGGEGERTLIMDGRALTIARHSADPDARFGRAAGGLGKGYKLHEIVDLLGNCRAFRVEPLHVSEQAAAREMIPEIGAGSADELLADANYDSNELYELAGARGVQMLAARRYAGAKGVGHHRHSPHRLRALGIMEACGGPPPARRMIESCFGTQGNRIGGLGPLPNHVRRLARVRIWVAAKLAIDAAHRYRKARNNAA